MDYDNLTDADFARLRSMSKQALNPRTRWHSKSGHRQKNFRVKSADEVHSFAVYARQNDKKAADFSCGILLLKSGRDSLSLARYNGSSHIHRDPGGVIAQKCHIHAATAEAIARNEKPDNRARETDKYGDLAGAIRSLVADYRIEGIDA